MMQRYFDSQQRTVIHCDPAVAPISPSWIAVSEADAERLRKQYAPTLSRQEEIILEIIALEAEITPRRLREAVVTGDATWITAQDAKIAKLREELKGLQ